MNRYTVKEVAYEIIRAMHPSYYYNPNGHIKAKDVILNVCQKHDVPWNVVSSEGTTLLHTFAVYDCLPAFTALINMGAGSKTTDNFGDTILHHAFNIQGTLDSDNNFDVIKWALDNGFNINDVNKSGQTPLFMLADVFKAYDVAESEQDIVVQFVEMFEACGGDIYHRDHQGRTFLDVLPTDNDEWMVLDPALDPWRIKMQRHRLNQEAQAVSHGAKTKGKKI